ncbi:MAG: DUF1634 domain-containing protein [Candidatus Bathyarchaeia archaeon]|jgi:uncharacterized membrane protein
MTLAEKESKLEFIVSILLIAGVVTSVIFEVIGIGLYFGSYGNTEVSHAQNAYISGENFFIFIIQKVQNLFAQENALLFMTMGIITLILTPYIRAITSCIYFAWEKNGRYVLITLFVLIVLTVSLIFH